ncbi:MAG: FAD-binding protein [Acidimicrobiales bacterium]
MPEAPEPPSHPFRPGRALLNGWGRTAPSAAAVELPADEERVAALLADPPAGHGVVPRGLGRSYGDAAQCAGGTVIDLAQLAWVGEVHDDSGEVEVGGGASLQRILELVLPRGWFLPVTPGTRQVTVGGAIAADVHGKNHHRDGSFAQHVPALTLATPTGVHRLAANGKAATTGTGEGTGSGEGTGRGGDGDVGRGGDGDVGGGGDGDVGGDPELFWATAGGMGLTGVVTRATVRLVPVETDRMLVDTDRHGDLDSVMSAMEHGDDAYRYSVAWVDCTATGRHTGRAILTRGDHARLADLPVRRRDRLPSAPGTSRLRVPRPGPRHLLNPVTVAAFNELWFRHAPRHRVAELLPLAGFFHPLDGIADWNLLYGDRGFLQYQFVVADGEVLARAVDLLASNRVPSFLAVLKRFGPGSPGPLSFPAPGWTLALDVPVGPPGLGTLLDRIDELVAEAAGRVYLAKDARLRPELMATMYPRLGDLLRARRRVDPAGLVRSDLSRRLGLDRKEAP